MYIFHKLSSFKFYAHTLKWQNSQRVDGGHKVVEVEVEDGQGSILGAVI